MRMIYCVRTAMVKSNADSYKLPTAANGTSHEARRVPEVTDDGDLSSEVDKISNPVAVDSWRPTIKDLKVSINYNYLEVCKKNKISYLIFRLSRNNLLWKTKYLRGNQTPSRIPLCAVIKFHLKLNLVIECLVPGCG